MRRLAIITGLAVVALLAVAWLLLPSLNWGGAVPRKVQLTVLDESSSAPIAGANVKFGDRDVGATDAAGKFEWTGMFPAGGTSGLFGRSGNWLVYGELAIVAPDGRSCSVRLDELVEDGRRSLRDDDPLQLWVPLAAPAASHTLVRYVSPSSPEIIASLGRCGGSYRLHGQRPRCLSIFISSSGMVPAKSVN